MRLIVSAVVIFAGMGTAAVSQVRFICQNPLREYLVVYDPGSKSVILNPDSDNSRLSILIDDHTDGYHIITASTGSDGPMIRLHLRPYNKMEFWYDGEISQTDGCYESLN